MTRHEARQCALQALYQMDASDSSAMDAIVFVLEDKVFTDSDVSFIRTLTEGTMLHSVELDDHIRRVMERWSTERVGRVELCVLRLAAYELSYQPDVPSATILDEAVRLAKSFSTETSGRFVNGVLARLLPELRPNSDGEVQESGSRVEE